MSKLVLYTVIELRDKKLVKTDYLYGTDLLTKEEIKQLRDELNLDVTKLKSFLELSDEQLEEEINMSDNVGVLE